MERLEHNPVRLSRAGIVMAVWGALILGVGLYNQWNFPSMETILLLWGGVTVVGLAVQGLCEVKDQRVNFLAWVAVVALGWAFTLYAIYATNYALFGHLGGIWLILLGLAYVPTALQIDRRYWIFAGLHFLVGGLMELSAFKMLPAGMMKFLDGNTALLIGVIGGGTLLVAAFFGRYTRETSTNNPAMEAAEMPS
jgi:hypothetical protein